MGMAGIGCSCLNLTGRRAWRKTGYPEGHQVPSSPARRHQRLEDCLVKSGCTTEEKDQTHQMINHNIPNLDLEKRLTTSNSVKQHEDDMGVAGIERKLDWQASLAEDSISSMVSSGIIASQTAQRLRDCLVKGGCRPEDQDQTQANSE
jgi:hypothetical protein